MHNIKLVLGFAFLAMIQPMVSQTTSTTKGKESRIEQDEFSKKVIETKLMEVIPTDSASAGDLLKRASEWMKAEALQYIKTNVGASSSNAECLVSFPVKPTVINPQIDYTGKITMKVRIECKNSRYRYTISDITHISKSGEANGGSVDNVVPECGSILMSGTTWKKLKGEMLKSAAIVAQDLKVGMGVVPVEVNPEEW